MQTLLQILIPNKSPCYILWEKTPSEIKNGEVDCGKVFVSKYCGKTYYYGKLFDCLQLNIPNEDVPAIFDLAVHTEGEIIAKGMNPEKLDDCDYVWAYIRKPLPSKIKDLPIEALLEDEDSSRWKKTDLNNNFVLVNSGCKNKPGFIQKFWGDAEVEEFVASDGQKVWLLVI